MSSLKIILRSSGESSISLTPDADQHRIDRLTVQCIPQPHPFRLFLLRLDRIRRRRVARPRRLITIKRIRNRDELLLGSSPNEAIFMFLSHGNTVACARLSKRVYLGHLISPGNQLALVRRAICGSSANCMEPCRKRKCRHSSSDGISVLSEVRSALYSSVSLPASQPACLQPAALLEIEKSRNWSEAEM